MKVKNAFFCRFEKKNYKVGDEYTGDRKDLALYLEEPKKTKELKAKIETPKKVKKVTKKKK